MANQNLSTAKIAKNDEFYTQYNDIQREINAYLDYDRNLFRDKTVLLPCDDPEWSKFTKFFAQNFEFFGLKKLISTSYAPDSKRLKYGQSLLLYQDEEFLNTHGLIQPSLDNTHGKIFTLTKENYRVDYHHLKWSYLKGDGDFRSDEVKKLRDEADFIVTNPPFSMFREFMAWLIEWGKKFLIIGNMNAITYKEIFPLIQKNKIWLGVSIHSGDREFGVPKNCQLRTNLFRIDEDGNKFIRISGVRWFTNIEHGRRHEPLMLMNMQDNLRFNKKLKGQPYQKYDNYDAIEVPYTDAIPDDYTGVMGVPISFLDKYCPEQFEILGLLQSSDEKQAGIPILRTYNDFKEMRQDLSYTGASGAKANGNPVLKGKSEKGNFLYNEQTNEYVHSTYARITIRKKQ